MEHTIKWPPTKYIKKMHGYWQLKGCLRKLLLECKAQESTRYAIKGICVEENKFCATDGRRLVVIEHPHKIEPGNYFSTNDGFLLDFIDGKFPDYQAIIPKATEIRQIVKTSGKGEDTIGLILGELCHAGCICVLNLYQRPIELLSKNICGKITVSVFRKDPESHPFVIEAETEIGHLQYIQMPVNVKNEATQ